jgi:hypothetical protein
MFAEGQAKLCERSIKGLLVFVDNQPLSAAPLE